VLDSLLSAARQTGDRASEAWALHQLGTREIGAGARQQALDFLRRALNIRQELGDIVGIAYTQHNINFLVGPPAPPRRNEPEPQSPKPSGGGINPALLIGGIALAGLVGLAVLGIVLRQLLFSPPPTSAPTPVVLPTVATSTPISDIITPTQPMVTMTATATPPAPTLTSIPTPIGGGSGWIAYVSDSAGNLDIYSMDLANPKPSALTSSQADDNDPAWSPNSVDLAFDSNPDGRAIYVTNVYDLAQTHSVTSLSDNSYPAWSPDGQKIAFVSVQDGNADIYVINVDGSEPLRLTEDAAWDADPTWSPDSKQIAFVSDRDERGGFQIYVMNADGSNQTRLPNNRPLGTWNSFPNWSHDGGYIVFQSRDNSDSSFQIYVMRANGKAKPIQLTSVGNNEMAEWSPDGKLIAFTTNRDGNNEVYMMNTDGSGQVNLTNNPANDSAPAWQPGGGN
jgi:Tol biopolymer transport system component